MLNKQYWLQAPGAHEELLGMAGQAADPAALLTVYLRHDRLADAADLVLNHLTSYQKVLSALSVSMKPDLEPSEYHHFILLVIL